jgi:hypothetical protein
MSDLHSNTDGASTDPLGAVKALTGPYLRMGLPGVMRPRIKSLGGYDTTNKKSESIKLTFAVFPLFCGDERSSFQY